MTKKFDITLTVAYVPLPDEKRPAYNLALQALARLLTGELHNKVEEGGCKDEGEAPTIPDAQPLSMSIHTPNIPNFPAL